MITRKVALALLAMGVSSFAAAGTYMPPACTSHAVSIPCEDSGWDVGFEVFFADATANDQNFGYLVNQSGTPNLINFYQVRPSMEFGFELSASLHFGTGNDLTVAWERLHDDSANSFFVATQNTGYVIDDLGVTGSGAFNGISANTNTAVAANTTVYGAHDYRFDAVNVEFGQHIDMGDDVDLRIHAGLQYANIDYTKTTQFVAGSTPTTYENDLDNQTQLVGARIGSDAAYYFGNGISAVNHASFSLLAGDVESTLRQYSSSANVAWQLNEVDTFASDTVVVPAAMLKSGINYGTDVWDGRLSVEGGWRWEGFFHSMRFAPVAGDNFENFTFSGPYVKVHYVA